MIALYFLAGLITGYFLAVTLLRHDKKYKELEEMFTEKTVELDNYQQQVADHFEETADLLTNMQMQQEKLIAHLANGATQLRYDMLDPVSELALKGPTSYAPKDYPDDSLAVDPLEDKKA